MWKSEKKNLCKFILPSLLAFICIFSALHSYLMIPSQQRITVGQQLSYQVPLPQQILTNISIHLKDSPNESFDLLSGTPVLNVPGTLELQFKLFDRIPIKSISVDVLPEKKVYPGGHSVGVLLQSRGVLVVGYSPIFSGNKMSFPARDAGIKEGDFILQINGQLVSSDWEIAQMIDQYGQSGNPLAIMIKQGSAEREVELQPVYCEDTKRYRVGLFVRDTTAGVGTMSFYDPENGVYGALGHVITDGETNNALEISRGKIVSAAIKGIEIGRRGQPGEKIGLFKDQSSIVGTIEKNTEFGIYGRLSKPITNSIYPQPIPIALSGQIKPGSAKMLTVVADERVEAFDIEIERVFNQRKANSKGMIIRITDQRLLDISGGIVQGMSGSPIIQDNKLVGAVTHVFVNDPTRGYGILAEWMLEEAEEISNKISAKTGQFLTSFCVLSNYKRNIDNESQRGK